MPLYLLMQLKYVEGEKEVSPVRCDTCRRILTGRRGGKMQGFPLLF